MTHVRKKPVQAQPFLEAVGERPFWKTLVPVGANAQRYEMLQEIASGGMATVYLGYRRGAGGFGSTGKH